MVPWSRTRRANHRWWASAAWRPFLSVEPHWSTLLARAGVRLPAAAATLWPAPPETLATLPFKEKVYQALDVIFLSM